MCFEPTGCIHLCKKGCPWGDHAGIQHRVEDKSGARPLLPNMHAAFASELFQAAVSGGQLDELRWWPNTSSHSPETWENPGPSCGSSSVESPV